VVELWEGDLRVWRNISTFFSYQKLIIPVIKYNEFYVLLTVYLGLIFVNNQLYANSFSCMFISILYMFRTAMCPSSGELIVSIRHLVSVTLYRWPFSVQVWMRIIQTCAPNGHLYGVTYTRCRIDIINSPDDRHMAARNMLRIGINIHEKELCVKLVVFKD